MYTWLPFYKELAKRLLEFRNRQPELIQILDEIRNTTQIPIIRLVDAPQPATEPKLNIIDPFTFFANFNRGLTDQNRIEMLKILKSRFQLNSEVPSDFDGVPLVDPRRSWFFPYADQRKSDDVDKLWDLAEAALAQTPEKLNPDSFNKCLQIITVGPAKLTMGLFWLNPEQYLALDEKNINVFERAGINIEVNNHSSYLMLLNQVREKIGTDYSSISSGAWQEAKGLIGVTNVPESPDNDFEALVKSSFWKVSPGDGAWQWDECRKSGFIAVGWNDFGNLSGVTRAEFDKRCEEILIKRPGWTKIGCEQLWRFIHIESGARIVANRGTTDVLGIGTVTGPYYFDPTAEQSHILPVKWDDLRPRKVEKGGWKKTLISLSEHDFNEILHAIPVQTPIELKASEDIDCNIILYGPPGTGKTYRLRNEYMTKFTEKQVKLGPEELAAGLVKDLSWWEVIALALLDRKENKASVAEILEHPLVRARLKISTNKNPRAMLWASLQIHTKRDCLNVNYSSRSEPLVFSKDESSRWSIDKDLILLEAPELQPLLTKFHNPLADTPMVNRWRFVTFHQSFSYEDFVEGIKPQMDDSDQEQLAYRIRDGVFKEICLEAEANPTKPYAIFIDEINRGNVASIFGELITLIEKDKRKGASNALEAVLPYSRTSFSVPPNLHIIGTMNTADRSVKALDTALRRRFIFIEMRPDPMLIKNHEALNVNLQTLLQVINDRIERLLDHDHCIGHYFFMDINSLARLKAVFANKIVPLLREYFYGSPSKIGMVLGERFVSKKASRSEFAAGSWDEDDFGEREIFSFADISKLTEEDFRSIYA